MDLPCVDWTVAAGLVPRLYFLALPGPASPAPFHLRQWRQVQEDMLGCRPALELARSKFNVHWGLFLVGQ